MLLRPLDTDKNNQNLGFFGKLILHCLKIAIFPLRWIPPRALLFFGDILGGLSFKILSRRRRIAILNLERAKEASFLPQTLDSVQIARQSFKTVAKTILESLAFQSCGLSYFEGRYSFQNALNLTETLEQIKENGTGLILLTAHLGNWELAPQVIREKFGLKIIIIGRTQGNLLVDTLIRDTRTQTGNGFVFKDQGAREMLRTLKKGGVIGTLIDQAAIVEREGAVLDFMGRKAHTNLGPVKLAAKTGSSLIPVFSRREGVNTVFEFSRALTPPNGSDTEWVLQAAQELNDRLAAYVRTYPEEWMWGHRRWKTPEGIKEDPNFF
jgi:KDO2-lipid IV(A) lauroyltransferase